MQTSKAEPDMLELPNHECKIPMIFMLRALMNKVDSLQEQMGIVSRETDIVKKK